MIRVSTLHVRNVPPAVYEALRARAARNGRSINAEVIEILRERTGGRTSEELLASIRARRERLAPIVDQLPDPAEVIREARNERFTA
jgi:plasmid stability protein